jgi:choice-of-anchor A domain-containing protein
MAHLLGKVAAPTAAALLTTAGVVVLQTAASPPAHALLVPVNPVTVKVGEHRANSGFLVFVEHDVTLRNDESEGTMAMGGDLRIQQNYQIAGASSVSSTFIDEGDAKPTNLFVGGGIRWDDDNATVYVQQGFTKVADTDTYTAHTKDGNGAKVNYRLTRPGRPYNSQPFIDGRSNQQTIASIAHQPSKDLINVEAAFDVYRLLTRQLAACSATTHLVTDQGVPLTSPFPSGARGRLSLTPGLTNVLTMTTADLANLSEITYLDPPTAATPLLINVVGDPFLGQIPNQAGISGSQAPYILWNFPLAETIRVTGGASIEGTIYAPHATLTWTPTQNIEGNVIASVFNHGEPKPGRAAPREIHDFPFSTKLSCAAAPAPPTATLTLVKQVINDDNGSAEPSDWTLSAVGQTPMSGPGGRKSRAVRKEKLDPGSYVLTENGPGGYDSLGWSCDGGTLVGDVLTLADGDNVTCTLTNDDRPGARPPDAYLTLVKRVVNDDGGSAVPGDWVLHASGPTPLDGRSRTEAVTSVRVRHGVYRLQESHGPGRYRSLGWQCTGGTMPGAREVRVDDGDTVVCTVTNDDRSSTGVGPIGPS